MFLHSLKEIKVAKKNPKMVIKNIINKSTEYVEKLEESRK